MVSSAVTGAFGVGGGVVLIVLMAQFVPPAVLVPLHAFVMLYSNTNRAFIQRAHVHWGYVWPFVAGSALGVMLVALWVKQVPAHWGQILLAAFVLVSTWRPGWLRLRAWSASVSGAITSALTMFLGATGPLVMSVLPRSDWTRHQVVGTHGMVMTFQHGVKALAFIVVGFSLADWWGVLLAMCVGATLGNWLGARVLGQLPEAGFKRILPWLLTVLALRLLWQGLT